MGRFPFVFISDSQLLTLPKGFDMDLKGKNIQDPQPPNLPNYFVDASLPNSLLTSGATTLEVFDDQRLDLCLYPPTMNIMTKPTTLVNPQPSQPSTMPLSATELSSMAVDPSKSPSTSTIEDLQMGRTRNRKSGRTMNNGKDKPVVPPFAWATDRRAHIHSIDYLIQNGITTITGDVQCKKCDAKFQIDYDIHQEHERIVRYIEANKGTLHDRAPKEWLNPDLPTCCKCHQVNSAKPIFPDKKKSINWLFLFLGQMLGCCTLNQLKYFCKHTGNHRTGAKDRVLYLTYLALCKQLDSRCVVVR